MEEEPEDTLNEGASSEGVWFGPCVCTCISSGLDFHSSNERNPAMVGSGSIDKGTRQQTGSEGLKEAQRWRLLCTVPGMSRSGVQVRIWSSGVRSRVGRGFSEWVAVLTQLSHLVFGDRL